MSRRHVAGILSILVFCLLPADTPQAQAPGNVLLLNSYHQGLQWTDNVVDGVTAFFNKQDRPVRLHIEYLDTKHIDDPFYFDLVFQLFAHKFRQRSFDVVIASDDHAFSFLLDYAEALFGRTPIVFCGVNYYTPAIRVRHPNTTGVIEAFDLESTLRLIRRLHPDLAQIAVINDRTKTGQANRIVIDGVIASLPGEFDVRFMGDTDMATLEQQLQELPAASAVLLMSFTRDRAGATFSYEESIRRIAASCPVPIYGIWDFYLGRGIVGGMLTSGYHQGYTAAGLAFRILSGEPVEAIDVVTESPNRWMFDDEQLSRFGLSPADLPAGARIINRPRSFYERHRTLIWAAGTIIVIQILVIGLMIFNIERRKAAQRALSTSEGTLKATFESTVDGVVVVNADGRVSHYNSRFSDIWSLPRELPAAFDGAQLVAHAGSLLNDPRRFAEEVDRGWSSSDQAEHLLTFKDGRIIEHYVTPLVAEGVETGRVWFFRDVTESRRKDDALRESEKQLRLAQAMAHVGNWELAVESGRVRGSEEALRIFGLGADPQPVGLSTLIAMVDTSDHRSVRRAMVRLRRDDMPFDREFRIRPQDSPSRCWVHVRARSAERNQGRPIRVVGTIQDVTDRVEAENSRQMLQNQLLQAQKMEAVGHLAGGIAHDFNNMLSVVLGNAELAMVKLRQNKAIDYHLRLIQDTAHRSSNLVRQLLAFARKQTVKPVVVDLNESIAATLKVLRKLIGEDIDLLWIPGRDLGKIRIDPSQIDQLLTNLVINARDAIGGVGEVTIETKNIHIADTDPAGQEYVAPGSYAMLAVRDNGCGMDPALREQIFEPFFTTKEVGLGTGLGLSTVYGIVKQNSGFIDVDSTPGGGTTFKILLPVTDAPPDPAALAAVTASPPTGTETVLVVEDDPNILFMVHSVLKQLGYTVIAAEQAKDALETVQSGNTPIDLLITDVIMPVMNGRELAERIQAVRPGIRCLYMSGYTADVIAQHGVLDAERQFLAKPFSIMDLARKVRAVLDG